MLARLLLVQEERRCLVPRQPERWMPHEQGSCQWEKKEPEARQREAGARAAGACTRGNVQCITRLLDQGSADARLSLPLHLPSAGTRYLTNNSFSHLATIGVRVGCLGLRRGTW